MSNERKQAGKVGQRSERKDTREREARESEQTFLTITIRSFAVCGLRNTNYIVFFYAYLQRVIKCGGVLGAWKERAGRRGGGREEMEGEGQREGGRGEERRNAKGRKKNVVWT